MRPRSNTIYFHKPFLRYDDPYYSSIRDVPEGIINLLLLLKKIKPSIYSWYATGNQEERRKTRELDRP